LIFDKGAARLLKGGSGGPVAELTLERPEGWLTPENVSLSTSAAMKNSVVARCVELRSNAAAMLPIYVMDERTKARFPEHRLGRVLWGAPNEAMTRFDYEKLMGVNKYLKGNAYAWIYRDPKTGWPKELIPLPSDLVTPYVAPDGRLWYVFFDPRGGVNTWLPAQDVLHYKEYAPDGISGVSILKRASVTLTTAQAAAEYERDLYVNGGQPSGVLTADSDLGGTKEILNEDGSTETVTKKEYLRREWQRYHEGAGNRFRLAVLDLGLKYQPIGLSNADSQFVESAEIRVADLCRFFGVPLHFVFAGKQAYNSNVANAIEFVQYTLQPDVTQREGEDTRRLLLPSEREKGLRVKRNMNVFFRGDPQAQAAWYKAMREAGAYSANDVRAFEDLEAVPGGDTYYSSLNYVPMEDFRELSRLRAGEGGNGKA